MAEFQIGKPLYRRFQIFSRKCFYVSVNLWYTVYNNNLSKIVLTTEREDFRRWYTDHSKELVNWIDFLDYLRRSRPLKVIRVFFSQKKRRNSWKSFDVFVIRLSFLPLSRLVNTITDNVVNQPMKLIKKASLRNNLSIGS